MIMSHIAYTLTKRCISIKCENIYKYIQIVLKSCIYLNKLKVIDVTLPAQKARHACGMPRARQHGV